MNAVLTIAGVLLTVIFGAWGVYLGIRSRYPGRLTCYLRSSIPLFDSIVRSVPEMKVLFREVPVQPGLVLLKLAVVNDGRIDITRDMVEHPLTFQLPSGFRWLAGSSPSAAKQVHAELIVEEMQVQLETRLLRRSEYVNLDLIAEVVDKDAETSDPSSSILNVLTLSHRIANTRSARLVHLGSAFQMRKRMRRYAGFSVGALAATILMAILFYFKGMPSENEFLLSARPTEWVHVMPHPDNTVTIRSLRDKDIRRIAARDFFLNVRDARSVSSTRETRWLFGMLIIYLSLPLVFLGYYFLQHRRLQKIYDLTTA